MYFYASLVFFLIQECYGIWVDLSWFGRHARRVDGYLKTIFILIKNILIIAIMKYKLRILKQLTLI